MNLADKLSSVTQQIMPHLIDSSSGIINKIGMVAIPVGLTNAAVAKDVAKDVVSNGAWLSVAEVGGIISAVSGLVFITNIFANYYLSRRKAHCDSYYAERKDKREQELHDKAMHED